MKKSNLGLYSEAYEHDACGVGMVVNIHGGCLEGVGEHGASWC